MNPRDVNLHTYIRRYEKKNYRLRAHTLVPGDSMKSLLTSDSKRCNHKRIVYLYASRTDHQTFLLRKNEEKKKLGSVLQSRSLGNRRTIVVVHCYVNSGDDISLK